MPQQASFAPVTARITRFERVADGTIQIEFADGFGREFSSFGAFEEWLMQLATPDTARALMAAWWLARNPDASNLNLALGKTLTFDITAPNPIKVQ